MTPIDIIIRAIWSGGQATQQAKRELAGIDDGARKGGQGLAAFAGKAALVTAGLAAITITAKRTYAAIEEGAGLRLTAERFDRLAATINTTGDALRENLSFATRGMLTNAQQMALATDLIGLGLANTEDQTIRLSRVVTELNQDVGELQLALANQTTRRFDQLGVSVAGFDQKLQALKGTMTDEQAFTMAFLLQAEEQIDRVGGVSGTAAGDLKVLQAQWKENFDALKIGLSQAVEPITSGLADMVTAATDAQEAVAKLRDEIHTLADEEAAVRAVGDAIRELGGGAGSPFAPVQTLRTREALLELATELARSGRTVEEQKAILRSFGFEVDDIGVKLEGMGISWIELGKSIRQANIAEEVEQVDSILTRMDQTTKRTAATLEEFIELMTTEHEDAFWQKQLDDVRRFGQELEELNRISREGLPDDVGDRANRLGQGRIDDLEQTRLDARANLFEDFQEDITSINERYELDRLNITEQGEARRTAVIESYNRQRAEEEEDWLLSRRRQEEDLRDSITDVRESAAESEAKAREQVNDRLEDLERDHLDRMQEIIDNANLQLTEAASRLDASAVARITRQRDAALNKERNNYSDQRREIEESLSQQLEAIRVNSEKRIEELEAFHAERQQREEEDRQIRLRRQEEEHRRTLIELKRQEHDRLNQLKQQARAERQERELQYIEEHTQLTASWSERQQIENKWQTAILQQEEAWWQQRLNLVGGGTAGDTGGGPSGIPGGGGDGGQQPSHAELVRLAGQLASAANWTNDQLIALYAAIQHMTAPVLADYIERTFDYDVPGYAMGIGRVPSTGLAMLHQGEAVLNPTEAARYRQGRGGINVTMNNYPSAGMDEAAFARHVRREFENVLREVA